MRGFLVCLLCSCAVMFTRPAAAMDGVFDRSAEVEKYVAVMRDGTAGAVIDASKEIYWSGISDKSLAEAINERLLRDYQDVSNPAHVGPRFNWTVDETYGVALIRALASLGIVDYIATFENIDKAANADKRINKRIHKAARQASVICNFHSGLNSVMASRESHIEGGDPMASMLINLIKSDDRLYRDFAMDRVHREKIRDSRIFDVLEAQVVDYLERSLVKELDWKDIFMRRNIQALGLSGDAKYKGTVQRVLASQVDAGAKKYAQVALSRLQ